MHRGIEEKLLYWWCLFNMLYYADEIVLLALLWRALQSILDCLDEQIHLIKMCCNKKKYVAWFLNALGKLTVQILRTIILLSLVLVFGCYFAIYK